MLFTLLAYVHAYTRQTTYSTLNVNTRLCDIAFLEGIIEVVLISAYTALI